MHIPVSLCCVIYLSAWSLCSSKLQQVQPFHERITASHEVILGKPVMRGTRLTMELLLRKMYYFQG